MPTPPSRAKPIDWVPGRMPAFKTPGQRMLLRVPDIDRPQAAPRIPV